MQGRFNQDEIGAKACNSKICVAYLKLRKIKISDKLVDKRDAARSCKESASNRTKR